MSNEREIYQLKQKIEYMIRQSKIDKEEIG